MVTACDNDATEIHIAICWSRDDGYWLAECLRTGRRDLIVQAMDGMVKGVGKLVRIRRDVPERM